MLYGKTDSQERDAIWKEVIRSDAKKQLQESAVYKERFLS